MRKPPDSPVAKSPVDAKEVRSSITLTSASRKFLEFSDSLK